jgi:hypothetical protein
VAEYERLPSSTCLIDMSYDDPTATLTVRFRRNGAAYRYFQVPREVYVDLAGVISAGRYFNARVLNAYSYERL